MRQLDEHLVMIDDWNHLTQTPGMLGLRKTEGFQAGRQLGALQSAGRRRHRSTGCGGLEHPALRKQLRFLPPTLQGQGLGLCTQALDVEMGNHTQFQYA